MHKQQKTARSKKIEVEIYKEGYTLIANSDPEYVKGLAVEVDRHMKSAAELNPHLGPIKLAILTLLELAAEVDAMQNVIDKQQQRLDKRCTEIEEEIERLLGVA
jgi:cell division protein ZapA (FtsZ GTPase activity inhibitor)